MNFDRKNFTDGELIEFYRSILLPRMIEEKMLLMLRQGKISKWFSGIGQEAIAAGATMAMDPDEWIFPLHRNLGVFTSRKMPLAKLFRQWQGSQDGYSKGRERSFHFGSREHAICGMISHLGPQLGVADGVGLAYKLSGQRKATLVFTGDGGTSEGDFHEALNTASVWDLPVIFLVENNGYALSTPVSEQYRCESLVYKAEGYGMEGVRIDGNNILSVYDTLRGVREYCIKYQRPYLVECMTFRMRGHEEASGTKYVPASLLEDWGKKDPVSTFEGWLKEQGVLNEGGITGIRDGIHRYIDAEIAAGMAAEREVVVNSSIELGDVYAAGAREGTGPGAGTGSAMGTGSSGAGTESAAGSGSAMGTGSAAGTESAGDNGTGLTGAASIGVVAGAGAADQEAVGLAETGSLADGVMGDEAGGAHESGLVNAEPAGAAGSPYVRSRFRKQHFGGGAVAAAADVVAEKGVAGPAAGTADGEVGGRATERRLLDAVREGLRQSMEQHSNLILLGQDIAEYGGAFKITEGLMDAFGKARVRNTPLCESAIAGVTLGLSLEGYKSVLEMQFADFVTSGFTQIVNNLAKIHYRWGQQADTVIRMPTGAGVGAGPFHSQSNEAWFMHVPGLKVVYPSTPEDAKGLLIAAINDPNPVLYFEHKMLYRSVSGNVPDAYYETPIGKARLVREGSDMTMITYGAGVHWALEYADAHKDLSIHVLDLRSLLPLDYDGIRAAVAATGKVLVLHEDTLTGGVGAEVAAWIGEHCFSSLDAPVMRCASLDTPVPFNVELEKNFLAKARLGELVERLMGY